MSITRASWRRPLVLAAAAAAATVVAVGAAAAAAAQPPQPFPIVDGTADWGVKESFRNYVTGPFAGGQITVRDGASENGDGTFRFGSGTGTYDPATHNVTAAFSGTVQFQAHASGDEWELDLTISDIAVATDNASQTGELTADVVSRDMATGEFVPYDAVTLAELDLADVTPQQGDGGAVTLADIPAVLTADGAAAFAGFYQPGDALDPVTLTVVADASPPDGGDDGDDGDGGDGGDGGDNPGSYQVVDGNLDWGFKESFRSYLTGPIANGSVTVVDGAVDNGDSYRFVDGGGDVDTEAQTLDVSFAGAVTFTGHHGELELTIDDVSVRVDGDEAVLYTGDLALADLALPAAGLVVEDDLLSLTAVPATLTADGTALFEYNGQSMYSAGEQLDPLTIHLALGDGVSLPGAGGTGGGGGGGGLPVTGAPLVVLVTAGAGLVLAGSGLAWLARRRRSTAVIAG